jgi:outer membrane receptor protein involved in Fe transport
MHVSVLLLILLVVPAFGAGVARAQDPVPTERAETSPDATDSGADAEAAADIEASEKPTPARPGIEEIVIRAGESEAAADFEAGDSVAAFDASDLEALGAQSVADLAAFTPNLEIVTSGATTPTFFIRGVGLNDFNANSSGAVAIYQNDVPLNAPALQLGTLFDVEAVNILRGPQGVGPYRNASAGAIKIYTRKPTGEFGAYLTSSLGNYDYMDFEGAVEAPIYEDILAARFAFRLSERDGYMKNGCGDAPPVEERGTTTTRNGTTAPFDADGKPLSICGESVFGGGPLDPRASTIEEGLPTRVNNLDNWSARGTLLFQPTLDMEWLLTVQGSRRDEQSRLGQAYGTSPAGGLWDPDCLQKIIAERGGIQGIDRTSVNRSCRIFKGLGGQDALLYRTQEVIERENELNRCTDADGEQNGACDDPDRQIFNAKNFLARNDAKLQLGEELADLDSEPWRGDFDNVGPTKNDVWGVALKGDVVLGDSIFLTTVSGYNTYDRVIDVDLDFTSNVLFEFLTQDDGWQFTQDLNFSGHISENVPVRWELGGFYLMEELNVGVDNFFAPKIEGTVGVRRREYTQTLYSAAGYASFEWDFWDDFTLDGGFRYNWENKAIDFLLFPRVSAVPGEVENGIPDVENRIWHAPTGSVRLTYRFREDTHAYWKYTRGWKGGHYNATGSRRALVGVAEPETIDAFEAGLRGSWFEGRLGANFSIFHYNYENYQIFTARQLLGAPPEFAVLNANNAELYGAELDLVARPLPGMYLQARLSWLESQFLDFLQIQQETQVCGERCSVVVAREIQNTGNPLLNSPKYKVSLTAEQTLPLGRYGSLSFRWDGAWTDDTAYDATDGLGIPDAAGNHFLPENAIGQSAFWLHNLRAGYRTPGGNVEVAGWVRNLTDEVYKTFAFDGSTFQDTTIYFVGEPRTYGGTITVTF